MQGRVQGRPSLVPPQPLGAESRHGLLSPGEHSPLPLGAQRDGSLLRDLQSQGCRGRTEGKGNKGSCHTHWGALCAFAWELVPP